MNYYPSEWVAAFLDKEPESRKEKAINVARSMGFNIKKLDVNTSGFTWEISEDGKTLIQPLSSIKGLGNAAIREIVDHRPFNTIEEFLFDEDISEKKLLACVKSLNKNNKIDVKLTKEYCKDQKRIYTHKNCKPEWCDECQNLTGYLVNY